MHLSKWIKGSEGRPVRHEEGSCVFLPFDLASLSSTLTTSLFHLPSVCPRQSVVVSALDTHKAEDHAPYSPFFI